MLVWLMFYQFQHTVYITITNVQEKLCFSQSTATHPSPTYCCKKSLNFSTQSKCTVTPDNNAIFVSFHSYYLILVILKASCPSERWIKRNFFVNFRQQWANLNRFIKECWGKVVLFSAMLRKVLQCEISTFNILAIGRLFWVTLYFPQNFMK